MQIPMTLRCLLATAALALPLSALAENDSPWLPIPSQFSLSLSHTEQSGDSAYIGNMRLPLSAITGGAASTYRRSTTQVRLGYGLADSVALDATLGAARVKVGAADSDSGQTDSVLGVSWRVLDEFASPGLPTLTLRGAAIVKGNYDGARLAAIGNDANGFELSLLVGKEFGSVFALWAQAGVQERSGAVPRAYFADLGARVSLGAGLGLSLGYGGKEYQGDLDIGGPGFTPARFQEVRAERRLARLGLSYALAGNQGLALNLARAVSGRNTVKDDSIASLAYTIGF
jgi:hypothetical protein